MNMRRWLWLVALVSGCGHGDTQPAGDCAEGQVSISGTCAPRYADDCNPDTEIALAGGGCKSVAIETCAEGFMRDAARGTCEPVLPPATCAKGMMAIPGDAACREVAPCAEGTWGDIPVDAGTLFVDARSTSPAPDGTRDRPFPTIGAAITAAADDVIVAIAAGTYEEHVEITRPVRLWGVCPSRVEIRGPKDDTKGWTVGVTGTAEIHRIAITTDKEAVGYCDNTPLLLDRVWIHDVGARGASAYVCTRDMSLVVRDSLVESATGQGIFGAQGSVVVERSVIRGTRPRAGGTFGQGVQLQWDAHAKARQTLTVKRSVIEKNTQSGITVLGSDLVVEGSVLRDTELDATEHRYGNGASITSNDKVRATGTLRDSLVSNTFTSGIVADGSTVTLERVVVRGTRRSLAASKSADGIAGVNGAEIDAHSLVLEGNARNGILFLGTKLTLASAIVRDSGEHGIQFQAANALEDPVGSVAGDLSDLLVTRVAFGGLVVVGANVTVHRARIRGVTAGPDGSFGDGVSVVTWDRNGTARGALFLAETLVEASTRAGVSDFGADLTMQNVQLRCNGFDVEVDPDSWLPGKELPFHLEDQGGNTCGCGALAACKAQSNGLKPVGL